MNKITLISLTLCVFAFAQDKLNDPRDGKQYKTVVIGTQTWMAENLNREAEGSVCYDNKESNYDKYGRLFGPAGWHRLFGWQSVQSTEKVSVQEFFPQHRTSLYIILPNR